MSHHDNDSDQLLADLGRELHHRADHMSGSTLDLATVRGRARGIKRRRTAATVIASAAAVAVIVPAGVFAGHRLGSEAPPPVATGTTQTSEPTQGPSEPTSAPSSIVDGNQPADGVLDVSSLPTGPAPQMDYLYDGQLHNADDGTAFDVKSKYAPQAFVEMNDGSRVFQTTDANGNAFIEIQNSDGEWDAPLPTALGLSVNTSHTAVAWMQRDGQVVLWEARATEPRPLGTPVPGSDLRLGPLTGDGIGAGGGSGPGCDVTLCTAYVTARDTTSTVYEVNDNGTSVLADGGFQSIADMTASGVTIGLDSVSDTGSCSKLSAPGEFQGFTTCKHTLVSFSPDGKLILADPAYHDGIGNGQIAMYAVGAKATPLWSRSSTIKTQAFYNLAEWEDDTHVLVPVYQKGSWSVVRFASDGSMEYAVAPAEGAAEDFPYVLPEGGTLR